MVLLWEERGFRMLSDGDHLVVEAAHRSGNYAWTQKRDEGEDALGFLARVLDELISVRSRIVS